MRSIPTAIGKLQQLNLVVDDDLWEAHLADTFLHIYQGPYLILPQPEPLYDVRTFTVEEILEDPIRRELKLFVKIANLSDTNSQLTQMVINDLGEQRIEESLRNNSFGVHVVRDKWAKGQLVVYLFGNSPEGIINGISRSFTQVNDRIQTFFESTIEAEIYGGGVNRALVNKISQKFGSTIRVPNGWVEAIEEENFLWLRRELRDASLSLIFSEISYENVSQLSPEYLRELRDSITTQYISSGKEGTFMTVEDQFLPLFDYQYRKNGLYTIELRGIWDMRNDFMGGPFQSFLFLNEDTNKLLFVDAFAYAPADDKRNHMIKLNHIVNTIEL